MWIVTRRRAVITTTQALIIILAAFMVGVGVSLSGVLTTNNAGNRVGGTTQQNTSVNVTNPQQTIPTQNTTLPNKPNTSNSTTQKPANNKQTINYTLTVEAPDGKGTQNPEEGIHHCPANSTVQVYANPSLGWEFTYWTLDNQKEVGNPITLTMNAPHTLKATFTETRYNLTITVEGSGTTNPVPGTHAYANGVDVMVNATAAEGWQFKCWTQNSENTTTNPITISVTRDTELKATFIEIPSQQSSSPPTPVPPTPTPSSNYTLTVNTVGQGSVARNPSKASYASGASVQLTATPAAGYTFTGWSGDASGSSNPLTVSMTGDKVVTATFTLIQFIVTSSAGSGGSISPSGATQVTQGSNQAFTITANTGYSVYGVVVDGSSVGAVSSYMFSSVQADHTIAATFAQIQYTVTVNVFGQGRVAKSPSQSTYTYGSTVQLTATPVAGYTFSGWSGDLSGSLNPTTLAVDGDKIVTATFNLIPPTYYTLTVGSVGNGSGSVALNPSGGSYASGTVVTLTATPSVGSSFSGWGGNLSGSTNPTTITMTGNMAATATFTLIEYTLSITVSPVAGGTVSMNPSQATYHLGDSVQLTATPAAGYTFTGWGGDLTGSANPGTVTIDSAPVVMATFTQIEYTLAVTISPSVGGMVTKSPNQLTYHYGDVVTLTESPNIGYAFSSWSGDGSGIGMTRTVTIDLAPAVTASFTQLAYTVTTHTSGSGSVSLTPNQSTYHYGDSVQLQATPSAGWVFSAWSGALTGSVNPSTLTVNGNMDVTASFTLTQFTITASAGSGGSISPSGGVVVSYGSSQAFTISHSTGYQVSDVLVDGVSVGAVPSYTFSGVQADHTISVTFAPIQFTITASAGSGGSISPNGSVVVNYGGSQSYTITANTGYSVSSVDVDGSSVGAVTSYQFSNVQDNHTITASFVLPAQFTITSSAGSGGSISPLGATQVTQGGNQVYTISPSTGYQVSDVLVDGVSVGAVPSYTFSSVQDNHNIVASFTQTVYTLTITVSPTDGGTVSISISPPYHYGDVVTLTESPGADYTFSSWSGDGSGTDTTCTITIMGNMAVTATFTLN